VKEANEFVGMGKRPAQNLAESKGYIFRLVSVDGEQVLGYPEDQRDDRVCVEVVATKVVKAVIR